MENRIVRSGLELWDDPELTERHFTGAMSESWLMHYQGRWRFLFFRPGEVLGYYAPTTLTTFLPASHWDYEALATLMSDYREAAQRLTSIGTTSTTNSGAGVLVLSDAPGNCLPAVTRVIAHARIDSRSMVASDSDEPRLTRRWNAAVRIYSLNHDDEHRLALVMALPTSELTPNVDKVSVRLTHHESSALQSSVVDTTIPILSRKQGFAYGLLVIPADPGRYTVGALLGEDTNSGFHTSDEVELPIVRGLRVSEILFGHEIVPIGVAFSGTTFPLTPFEFWSRDTPLLVGYQISGAQPNVEVEVVTEVIRQGRRGNALSVSRRERAGADGTTQRVIRLGLRNLDEGNYVVRVLVRHDGVERYSQRRFSVVK